MVRKIAILPLFFIILSAQAAHARVDTSTDASAQIELNVRLEIPTHLFLRIGTPGSTVDTVRFNVTGIPQAQPQVQGDLIPMIAIRSNAPTGCELTADSSGGLRGPAGTIPFSSISFEGTSAFSNVKGKFNQTANQKMMRIYGTGMKEGSMRFIYNNTYKYPPGMYVGTVTYTLSTP